MSSKYDFDLGLGQDFRMSAAFERNKPLFGSEKDWDTLCVHEISPFESNNSWTIPPADPSGARSPLVAVNMVRGMNFTDIPAPNAPFTFPRTALLGVDIPDRFFQPAFDTDPTGNNEFNIFFQRRAPQAFFDQFLHGSDYFGSHRLYNNLAPITGTEPTLLPPHLPPFPPERQTNTIGQCSYWYYQPRYVRYEWPPFSFNFRYFWENEIIAERQRAIWKINSNGFLGSADLRVYHVEPGATPRIRYGYRRSGSTLLEPFGFYEGVTPVNFSLVEQFTGLPAYTWKETPLPVPPTDVNPNGYPGEPIDGWCGRLYFTVFFETPSQWETRTGFVLG